MKKFFIELDKKREIKFDINALSDFEDLTGKSIIAIVSNPLLMGVSTIRALIFSSLVDRDPETTLITVGEWISETIKKGKDLKGLMKQLSEAMQESLSAEKSKTENP